MTEQTPKLDVKTLEYVLSMLKAKHEVFADAEYEIRCGRGDASRLAEASWKETALRFACRDIRLLIEAQQEA